MKKITTLFCLFLSVTFYSNAQPYSLPFQEFYTGSSTEFTYNTTSFNTAIGENGWEIAQSITRSPLVTPGVAFKTLSEGGYLLSPQINITSGTALEMHLFARMVLNNDNTGSGTNANNLLRNFFVVLGSDTIYDHHKISYDLATPLFQNPGSRFMTSFIYDGASPSRMKFFATNSYSGVWAGKQDGLILTSAASNTNNTGTLLKATTSVPAINIGYGMSINLGNLNLRNNQANTAASKTFSLKGVNLTNSIDLDDSQASRISLPVKVFNPVSGSVNQNVTIIINVPVATGTFTEKVTVVADALRATNTNPATADLAIRPTRTIWFTYTVVDQTNATDAFQTAGSGNWSSNSSWQSKANETTGWLSATSTPGASSSSVLVKNGHTLTLDATVNATSITVEPQGKLTIATAQTLNLSGNLVLQSDENATATIDNKGTLNVTGTVTVQQHLTSVRNWYVSSPFTNATAPASNTYYEYIEPGNNTGFVAPSTLYWKSVSSGATLASGKGYIVKPTSAPATFSLSGTLADGNLPPVNLTRTTGKDKEGFNLVGNPYPSFLDVSSLATNTDVESSFWLRSRNAGNTAWVFDSYNFEGAVSSSNSGKVVTTYIPPMQAFWVRVASGKTAATINFTNNMRAHQDDVNNKFRVPSVSTNKIIGLQVSNDLNSDETVIYFNTNADNNYDRYDTQKMFNNTADIPEIYTTTENEQLVINGMKDYYTGMQIPLGFNAGQSTSYKLRASRIENFDTNTRIVLIDKMYNTEFDLSAGDEYTFASNPTASQDRFAVLFKSATGTTGLDKLQPNSIVTSTDKGFIHIKLNSAFVENAKVSVFNALGQLVHTQLLKAQATMLAPQFESGIYVLQVQNGGYSFIKKTVVK
jgi:hypothetical protein